MPAGDLRIAATVLALLLAPPPLAAHVGLDEVGRTLDAEIASRPHDSALHLQRARAHLAAGAWDAALHEVDHAVADGADPVAADTLRGEAHLGAGRPRRALRAFDAALARRPDAWGTLFLRGRARLALKDPAGAADDFGRAIARLEAPRPEQVLVRRDALLALGRRADALRALDEGMARLGPVASLQLAAVDLEVALRRWDAALARLDRLCAANPPNPAWLARRGDLLARAGRRAEARAAWQAAVDAIERRPAGRRAAFADLHRTLATRLASTQHEKEIP